MKRKKDTSDFDHLGDSEAMKEVENMHIKNGMLSFLEFAFSCKKKRIGFEHQPIMVTFIITNQTVRKRLRITVIHTQSNGMQERQSFHRTPMMDIRILLKRKNK